MYFVGHTSRFSFTNAGKATIFAHIRYLSGESQLRRNAIMTIRYRRNISCLTSEQLLRSGSEVMGMGGGGGADLGQCQRL